MSVSIWNTFSEWMLNSILNERWLTLRKIGEGHFGLVYEVQDLCNQGGVNVPNRKALKIHKWISATGRPRPKLMAEEVEFLKQANNSQNKETSIVRLWDSGTVVPGVAESQYIVIDLVGPDLEDIVESTRVGFSMKSTLKLALLMFNALREVHSMGWVHRGVKPSNFALPRYIRGLNEDDILGLDRIYIIDFGRARRYLQNPADPGSYIPAREYCRYGGTIHFCSIAGHKKQEHAPHNDLQSLLYCIVYLHHAVLPWSDVWVLEEICWLKGILPANIVFKGFADQLVKLHNYFSSLRYGMIPDYNFCQLLLQEAMMKHDTQ